jgi:hypothetical protein
MTEIRHPYACTHTILKLHTHELDESSSRTNTSIYLENLDIRPIITTNNLSPTDADEQHNLITVALHECLLSGWQWYRIIIITILTASCFIVVRKLFSIG